MIDHDEENFDYKIIDVLSIKKPEFKEIEINPYSILFYHNFVKHESYNEPIFYSFLTKNNHNNNDIEKYLDKLKKVKIKKIFNRK